MTSQENYKVSSSGYYGKYGGAFVPEMLCQIYWNSKKIT